MSSIKRKALRNKKKKKKKELQRKIALFDKLADECLTCNKPFDKTDREQVSTWNVVVRNKEGKVNLYCPDCWNKAINMLEDFERHLKEKNDN